MDFNYKSLVQLKKMTIEDVNSYYRNLRKYEYENNIPVKGVDLRKKTYKLIKLILKIDKLINKRTVTIIGDKRVETDKAKIYACTHIGRYDIESALEAIDESAWLLMGDPSETYLNLDGLILRMNGVSWFDTDDKFDAHTVNIRQQKILSEGGNELCFPEAAWNLSPVNPVGEINPGVVKRAIRTNSDIVPIAVEQYQNNGIRNYYVNIGKNISLTGAKLTDAKEISSKLRDDMASLKWDIWSEFGKDKRKNIPSDWNDGYNSFIDSIMCDTENGYTIDEINRTKYVSMEDRVPDNREVFKFLEKLNPSRENAFLLKKKLTYGKINSTIK